MTILTHLSSVWLDDAAEPVQRHAHDGQRGHEGRHAGEGLDQAASRRISNVGLYSPNKPAADPGVGQGPGPGQGVEQGEGDGGGLAIFIKINLKFCMFWDEGIVFQANRMHEIDARYLEEMREIALKVQVAF